MNPDGERTLDGPARPTSTASPPETHARLRQDLVGWSVAAMLVLAAVLPFLLPRFAKVERGAAWGLVVLIGFAGWGGLVERLAFPGRRGDLGLRLAWGAAALIAAGGVLSLATFATAPVLFVLVFGGVALSVRDAARARHGAGARLVGWLRRWEGGVLFVLLVAVVMTGVYYVAGASGWILNGNDDQAAYLIFPKKLLATGTLIDPFSLRRVTAFGGHSYLQALTLLGAASPLQVSMLDLGISLAIAVALVVGAGNEKARGWMRNLLVLPVIFLVGMQNIRLNSASAMSGVVFFLAMFRTAASRELGERPAAAGLVLAMLAAAACTLRQSYLVPVAVFMVVLYLPTARAALRAPAGSRRPLVVEVARPAAALLLFLLPWLLLAYRSHRTFLFPFFTGNYRPEYGGLTTASPFVDRVKFFWANIFHCTPVHSIALFLLAAILVPARRVNGALRALLWAGFLGFVCVVYSLPLSDQQNIARYYYGFTVAFCAATMLTAFEAPWRGRAGRLRMRAAIPAIVALVAVTAQLEETRGNIFADYLYLGKGILAGRSRPSTLDDAGENYRRLQQKIPAGAPLLVMLDDTFWLDFKRNRVDFIDLPGSVSPAPGMPLDDDERLVRYLDGLGYRYVAYTRSSASKSLYRRDHWTKMLTESPDEIWRLSAPFYLNMFDRFDSLAKSRVHLYEDGQMVALDLGTRSKS